MLESGLKNQTVNYKYLVVLLLEMLLQEQAQVVLVFLDPMIQLQEHLRLLRMIPNLELVVVLGIVLTLEPHLQTMLELL